MRVANFVVWALLSSPPLGPLALLGPLWYLIPEDSLMNYFWTAMITTRFGLDSTSKACV